MKKNVLYRFLRKLYHKLFGLDVKRVEVNSNPEKNFFKNGDANQPFSELPFAGESMEYLIKNYDFETILDIGSGEGRHSDLLVSFDKRVTSIDYGRSVYFEQRIEKHTCIFGDYYEFQFEEKFDAIWISHVLEHQPNPNLFLTKVHSDLKEGGVLAITVPPLKHEIVGGHVSLWNAGLLMYNLVLAGFNCKDIRIKSYGYNIGIMLVKKSILNFPELSYDKGDIIKLKEFFPDSISEPFDGDIKILNW
ncbi:bifunctional 2-polyprenyl-6-hydroxyphenol methylase/3-demethylubiquinol 3-O-methyltransferase UbiG [Winogradskyella sp. KYW1333]|uniref:class I SAM-dependent methyltransferase n=1 Tax=Winogradskyella sp. KYW1333 TaxID=2282123 RepID=UPI000DF36B42|nr:class I SAM-dependent methyltransferase [Winogradskyella sp. KYW1333]RCT54787.1 class I SAM-dependent methyltransferase [Winogradskyella sp. KYW1333]